MAVADASVIAHEVTGVIYVVGSDMIGADIIERAVGELQKDGAKIARRDPEPDGLDGESYYYSRYHRSEYETYYTQPSA